MLKALCDEFNDLNAIDKLASVQSKVDGVRTVMQSNIQSALKNTDKLEDIDEKAVVLAESANKFKNSSAGLKRNMRWRYIRMVSIMVLLVAAVLAVIIVPIVVSAGRRRQRRQARAPAGGGQQRASPPRASAPPPAADLEPAEELMKRRKELCSPSARAHCALARPVFARVRAPPALRTRISARSSTFPRRAARR